jgi:DNA ligase 1
MDLAIAESLKDVTSTQEDSQSTKSDNLKGTGPENLMLAKNYEPLKHNPKGWVMSEKLDGVRCYWNGVSMFSRNGKIFYPPKWFKDQLPKNLALDGELWTKRDDF